MFPKERSGSDRELIFQLRSGQDNAKKAKKSTQMIIFRVDFLLYYEGCKSMKNS